MTVDGQPPVAGLLSSFDDDTLVDQLPAPPRLHVSPGPGEVVPHPPPARGISKRPMGRLLLPQHGVVTRSRPDGDSSSPSRRPDEPLASVVPQLQSLASVSPLSTPVTTPPSRSAGMRSTETGFRRVTTDPEHFSPHRGSALSCSFYNEEEDDDANAEKFGEQSVPLAAAELSQDESFASPSVRDQDELWRFLSTTQPGSRAPQR